MPSIDGIPNGVPGDQQSIQTIHFVDFPKSELTGPDLETKNTLQKHIRQHRAYLTTASELHVRSKISSNEIKSEDVLALASYRAQCHDEFQRKSAWVVGGNNQNNFRGTSIRVKKGEFHAEVLKTVLDGFMIPETMNQQLEKVLQSICNNILKAIAIDRSQTADFYIEIVRYATLTSSAIIRTIQFRSNGDTGIYMALKDTDIVEFEFAFAQYDAEFDRRLGGILEEDPSIAASVFKGHGLMEEVWDIPI